MKFIIAALVLFSFAACSEDDNDPQTATLPVFSATPVDISGPYDDADSTYGDIKFISPVIVPFGTMIEVSWVAPAFRLSPAIEYYTIPGAPIIAVTAGIVDTIMDNPIEQGDQEIHIIALPGSDYLIIYDHVLNVTVLESSTVSAGDTIGYAGTWSDNIRRVGLQVNLGEGNDERSYCPLDYGDSAFVEQHRRLLNEYNNRGFTPPYDTLCLSGAVTP